MRTKIIVLLCAALLPVSVVASQSWPPTVRDLKQCRANPGVVASCFLIHGRMYLANGSPSLRIWHVGTERVLGVLPPEQPIVPPGIRKHLAFGVMIYADFEVCPFIPQKPGAMQLVCVQSASHVVIQDLREHRKEPQIQVLKGTFTLAPNRSFKRTRKKPRAA